MAERLSSRGPTPYWDASRPVFVELEFGGNKGHTSAQCKQKYPQVAGRVILQNVQPRLDKALKKLAHKLFQSPPIRGSQFYYLQRVFHNLTPQNTRKLLQLIKEPMTPESVLLIDEAVPPETDVDYIASTIDVTMLGLFGAIERSDSQWRETLDYVGLELVKTHVHNRCIHESFVEVRLQQ